DRGVVAEYRRDGIDKGRFAVCAGAVGEDKLVLACDAGGGVAAITLQEALQLAVPGRDPIEESRPQGMRRAVRGRGAAGLLGDVIGRGWISGDAGAQVNCRAVIL